MRPQNGRLAWCGDKSATWSIPGEFVPAIQADVPADQALRLHRGRNTISTGDIEMRISAISIPLLVAFALPESLPSQAGMPIMRSVEPASGRIGDVLVITGENLGPESVAALYLTDGKTDVKVPIIEQTATSIRFRIPPEAIPGRLALMVLTRDKPPRLIEEPVKITVEAGTSSSKIPASGNETIRLR